ncbi:probable gluconokinase isoform X1 [Ostrea edulis]|uniref:probable gluconokinase isoform X1 n=1 Tax=Ostrea edulis TaxID=37623 RepID=UPI0024AF9A98|nr:probable gluconokinase isoform X1 [Ostrea edulis]
MPNVFQGQKSRTTIGTALAEKLGLPFRDADEFHSMENKKKMSQGIALTDQDRRPWLLAIYKYMRRLSKEGNSGVVTCSALRKSYRDILVNGCISEEREPIPEIVFVLLHGSRAVLQNRLDSRSGHFMPTSLLDSQLATLEIPTSDEKCVQVDISMSPDKVMDQIIERTRTIAIKS